MSTIHSYEELESLFDTYRPTGTDAERKQFATDIAAAVRRHLEFEGLDASPEEGTASEQGRELAEYAGEIESMDPADTHFDNSIQQLRQRLREHADTSA